MFAAAETTRAVPTMGATATRISSTSSSDVGIGRRFDVEGIGRSGCVHRDQGGAPGDHELTWGADAAGNAPPGVRPGCLCTARASERYDDPLLTPIWVMRASLHR